MPAGSYVVNGKATVNNNDDGAQGVTCVLKLDTSDIDVSTVRLEGGDNIATVVPMQAAVDVPQGGGSLSLHGAGYGTNPSDPLKITAITVGGIN